jgi:hypothetical protein
LAAPGKARKDLAVLPKEKSHRRQSGRTTEAPERFKASGIAELLHELNDLLDKKNLDGGRP